MVKNIVSDNAYPLKGEHQTGHTFLCAILRRAHFISQSILVPNKSESDTYRLNCELSALIKFAYCRCEALTAQDFEPVK